VYGAWGWADCADARFVAFSSLARNMVAEDTNFSWRPSPLSGRSLAACSRTKRSGENDVAGCEEPERPGAVGERHDLSGQCPTVLLKGADELERPDD
jgi:hypothetical protein